MKSARIAFVDLPRMLREILKNVLDAQPDFSVVAEYPSGIPLITAARESIADVLIAGMQDASNENLDEVVTAYPKIKVMAIEASGRWMFIYELCPRRITLGEVSPAELVDVIRGSLDGAS